jgi:protease I
MGKIAVLFAEVFEDVEYTEPAAVIKAKGHELIHVGLEEGKTVRGKKKGTKVKIDRALNQVSADTFDALLIPRSYTFDDLRTNEDAVQFVKEFWKRGKPVLASRRLSSSE